jgi:hypothetical protein
MKVAVVVIHGVVTIRQGIDGIPAGFLVAARREAIIIFLEVVFTGQALDLPVKPVQSPHDIIDSSFADRRALTARSGLCAAGFRGAACRALGPLRQKAIEFISHGVKILFRIRARHMTSIITAKCSCCFCKAFDARTRRLTMRQIVPI